MGVVGLIMGVVIGIVTEGDSNGMVFNDEVSLLGGIILMGGDSIGCGILLDIAKSEDGSITINGGGCGFIVSMGSGSLSEVESVDTPP